MNGSAPAKDRAFSALAYVMPLASVLQAGSYYFLPFLRDQAPAVSNLLNLILLPLGPLLAIENSILGLGVFILLFAFVVRNPEINRFIRFNVLQAIMVSFVISILVFCIMTLGIGGLFIGETLLNVLCLGGFAIVGYSVAQCVLGQYAEIPTISDAINMQLP
ncbi:MAG: Tic20 family protein [Phormidesmis sp.]